MVLSHLPIVTIARIYTTEPLDRESVSQYRLTVLGQDTTDQPLSDMSQITIVVLDFNDNVPKFEKDIFTFTVREESALSEVDGVLGSISVC